ncbi:bifunctional diguanylate cyclase/phosphodiesterase [Calidifontibacillus erzurumensis]|uniref:EAL domain-containing protein n=1 Tax=Calidifontibacillus erzurumensis TaxID=2741433 RepID=A0A8J8KCP0_9BACI|nr:EAL domain-containing protein [Calidifontibacillus erzurumensis]NSL52822.1 EAL domain-containing protein [Calidifontibacillus erzurumensis]
MQKPSGKKLLDLDIKNKNVSLLIISLVILMVAVVFRESLYGVFGEENYLTIHLLMEIFIITTAFMIAIQSWMIFPHILSSFRLWIGALFFAIGILEVVHTINYKGMPFFLSESSSYKATWFFMAARLTEVMGMLAIILSKDRLVSSKFRILAYSVALVYSVIWIIIIYSPIQLLPALVVDGIGTTSLKNNLQYLAILIEIFIVYFIAVRFRSKEVFNNMLMTASIYLMISDYFFTTYKSVYDINNFIGHWFQLAGFYFLQRAVYHTSVEEPFELQKEAEMRLLKNEKFLQTITSNMGEGLIVTDKEGYLTYINREAERLLGRTRDELLEKRVHDYIHVREDGTPFPFSECPCSKINEVSHTYRVKEDYFIRKNGEIFPVSYVLTPLYEEGQATGAIMVFQDITQMKKDQEIIHHMAFHDELTKLPNLRYLKEKWPTFIGKNKDQKGAFIIIDINRFKNINEALGHAFGDLILQAVAERLQGELSEDMFLCRHTGDEFVLVIPNDDQEKNETKAVLEKIHSAFQEPLQAQQLQLNIALIGGVAFYPQNGTDLEELLQRASIALMEAKHQNRSFEFFQFEMDGKALDNLVIENDLYHALEKNQLVVVFQPQIDLCKGEIIGLEALIRWHHPTHGFVSPGKFISIAEETGLIIPIGEWVLRTACQQLKQWHDQGLPPFRVAVNLSIRQFYQQDLVEKVKEILDETGLAPEYLELEVTESMMMNIDHTKKTLDALKQLGVQIAIDDFGTGYSSLSYLKHLPVDRLKIDRSFVSDIVSEHSDVTIISTIISMAQFLNLEVIAEGVETLIQKEILESRRCMQIQGYLTSPPMTSEQFSEQFPKLQQKVRLLVKSGMAKNL